MSALGFGAWALWLLGYPEQALRQSQASLTLAHGLAHPFSLAYALMLATIVHQYRREWDQTQEQAEAAIALATEQGFPFWVAQCTIYRGTGLGGARPGRPGLPRCDGASGDARHRGRDRPSGSSAHAGRSVSERRAGRGRAGDGGRGIGLCGPDQERFYEAELYRLKGALTLQSSVQGLESRVKEAEECFLKAIDVARRQQAKSLELRAAMSLARLWQQQGKTDRSSPDVGRDLRVVHGRV